MEESSMNPEGKLSRRRFFSTAGVLMTGAVATAAGCTALSKKETAEAEQVTWPYPYAKLDPEDVRMRAYLGYYKGQ